MSGRAQTGHNQMLQRRRQKQLRKKRLVQAAKRAEPQRAQDKTKPAAG
jgi:hypothetical protein